LAVFAVLISNQEVLSQGCVAVRPMSCSASGQASNFGMMEQGQWQLSSSYHYFKSFRHFRGDVEEKIRVEEATQVENITQLAGGSILPGVLAFVAGISSADDTIRRLKLERCRGSRIFLDFGKDSIILNSINLRNKYEQRFELRPKAQFTFDTPQENPWPHHRRFDFGRVHASQHFVSPAQPTGGRFRLALFCRQ
jgi:hypothetical protein